MSHLRRPLSGLLAAVAATVAVSACGPDGPRPCPTDPVPPGMAIAVGAHGHSPLPAWPDLHAELEALVRADQQGAGGQGVTLLRVDGRPSVGCVVTHDNSGGNDSAREAAKKAFLAAVPRRARELRALEPETNPLAALDMAAGSAGAGGTVVLVDSGLQTVAPLDFREPGLLDADPEQVVAALREARMLPDLRDRTVILAGIGYTAAPQDPLSTDQRNHLVQLWEQIARAAGAGSVRSIATPSTAPPVDGLPPVGLVPIPPPGGVLTCNTASILADDGPVGFRAGSTDFVDDSAARRRLGEFADWLVHNPSAHGHVVGTIAHHGENVPHGLSADRAERVREMLVELGADPDAVTAEGAGWGPFPTPSAPPGPSVDPLNRRVVVELRCP